MSLSSQNKNYWIESFRNPSPLERQIGLWVDRIGHRINDKTTVTRKRQILEQYAATYIESGEGEFESETIGKQHVEAPNLIITFPHEITLFKPNPLCEEKWIIWNGPQAFRLEKMGFLTRSHILLKDHTRIVDQAYHSLKSILSNEDMGAVLQRKNIIEQMILELFQISRQVPKKHYTDRLMSQAVEYFSKNYQQQKNLSDLIDQFNLSESHFRRLFRDYTGRSPQEFITSIRIAKAKELLCQNEPITKVAFDVGYNDVSYFIRCFKKVTGITPGNFVLMNSY
jgi:AraC-like DNA-binding protein